MLLVISACSGRVAQNTAGIPTIGRATRIRDFIGTEMYGPGALEVLAVAEQAVTSRHADGAAELVTVEDLWAHALQEGLILFNDPKSRWGPTTAEETADMIGQTTVGPWQMTVQNIRHIYGPTYGVESDWSDEEIVSWARENPVAQGKMIADYIQKSYEQFGQRSPYAIQRYFWLEPYVRGEIGQAMEWWKSPVAKPASGGTWEELTATEKRNTGFYAKQVLMGTSYTKSGLLFWLIVSGDEDAAKETVRVWRDQEKIALRDGEYVGTGENGGFALSPDDVRYADAHDDIRERMKAIIDEVNAER